MKFKRHLKMLAVMLSICAVFTGGRLIAEKYWGITYNARSIELLIGVFFLLHLGIPFVLKKLKKGEPVKEGQQEGSGAYSGKPASENR